MLKSSLMAAALFALPAAGLGLSTQPASAQADVACASGAIGCQGGGGHAPYGYDNSTSALGRYCPPGYYPHSSPDSNGVRCEPPGDTTQYIAPE